MKVTEISEGKYVIELDEDEVAYSKTAAEIHCTSVKNFIRSLVVIGVEDVLANYRLEVLNYG